jgi:hypothetical protein
VRDGFRSAEAGDWFDEVATLVEEVDTGDVDAHVAASSSVGSTGSPMPGARRSGCAAPPLCCPPLLAEQRC